MRVAGQEQCDDRRYLGLIDGLPFQPIFIMGDHRSGTTLLYQLLDAANCFNVVRAYHLIRYDEVLANHTNGREGSARQELADLFNRIGVTDRLLDGVRVTPDLPEEYGFRLDQNFRPKLTPQNLSQFVELCRKVQFVSEPGRPLLLKNPWDFANFMYVKETFPQARFIFLHRHPVHVINSQIKAARQLYSARSPYHALLDNAYDQIWNRPLRRYLTRLLFSPLFGLGLRVAARHVARATRYFLDNVGRLSETVYVEVKFEDLCADPRAAVATVLRFLRVKPKSDAAYETIIQRRPTRLLDEVRRGEAAIMNRLRPYTTWCRYSGSAI